MLSPLNVLSRRSSQRPHFYSTIIVLVFLLESLCYGQSDITQFSSATGVQYGYGLKLQFDLSSVEVFSFRVGISGGIGAFAGDQWFYPAANADLMIYRAGMGSGRPGPLVGNWIDIELIVSYSFTAGLENRLKSDSPVNPLLRDYPLYYFNTWCQPALQSPYRYSATWGGNAVFMFTKTQKKAVQLVGFANLHIDRFQANYLNDGPPFFPPFGDRYDRYHTGGGYLTWHDERLLVELIEVGYNKFTGYNPSAYELSNKLGSSYVFFDDMTENYYNKSNLYVNLRAEGSWGLSAVLLNQPALDFQHKIHVSRFFPLFLVPYESGMSAGGFWTYRNTKVGMQ